MRVLMIVPGGVEEQARLKTIPALMALIRRIAERHELVVVALRQEPHPRSYPLLGARVHNLGYVSGAPPGTNAVLWAKRLRAVLRAESGDFSVIHAFWLGWPASLAMVAARRLGAPTVFSLGGGELARLTDIRYGGRTGLLGRIQARLALRRADRVTAGSRFALSEVHRTRRKAIYLPLFPETAPFARRPRGTDADRRNRLLTVSSINRVKDPDTMLRALARVAERVPEVHLDWVGVNTLGDMPARLVTELRLEGNVTFHGLRPYGELPAFYHRAGIYVQASRYESQGVAVCEAASAGLAIVGTDVGILQELAPACAVSVPPQDPAALAGAIVALLADTERQQRLGQSAAKWANEFTADWTAKHFEEVYASLSSSSPVTAV